MNSDTVEVKCNACGQVMPLNRITVHKNFYYVICSNLECQFPIGYLDASAQEYNTREVRKYMKAVGDWASSKQTNYQDLQRQKSDIEERYNLLITQQPSTSSAESSNSDYFHQSTQRNPTSQPLPEDIDRWLESSQIIASMQQQLQLVAASLSSLEEEKSISQPTEPLAAEPSEFFSESNSQEASHAKRDRTPDDEDDELNDIVYELEAEQSQAKKSQWLQLYNDHTEEFVHRNETQLAGATKETLEDSRLNRLSRKEDALFLTGNGNYWLMRVPNQRNVAFLMPNRKRIRFSQNDLDSVKVCFHLTHWSVENLSFNVKNASFDQFDMLVPAVVDSDREGLWRLRQKGVLRFPLRE